MSFTGFGVEKPLFSESKSVVSFFFFFLKKKKKKLLLKLDLNLK